MKLIEKISKKNFYFTNFGNLYPWLRLVRYLEDKIVSGPVMKFSFVKKNEKVFYFVHLEFSLVSFVSVVQK